MKKLSRIQKSPVNRRRKLLSFGICGVLNWSRILKPKPPTVDRKLKASPSVIYCPLFCRPLMPMIISHKANTWRIENNTTHCSSGGEEISTKACTIMADGGCTYRVFFSFGLGHLSPQNGTRHEVSILVVAGQDDFTPLSLMSLPLPTLNQTGPSVRVPYPIKTCS